MNKGFSTYYIYRRMQNNGLWSVSGRRFFLPWAGLLFVGIGGRFAAR